MKQFRSLLVAAVLFAPAALAATRNGDLDRNFGSAGQAFVAIGNGDASWADVVRLPDGKLLLGGSYDAGPATGLDMVVVRLNPDGSIDTGFGVDGRVGIAVGAGASLDLLSDLMVQADGKVVLVGIAQSPVSGNGLDMAVVRLTADGELDDDFGDGGKVFVHGGLGGSIGDDEGRAVAQLADGRLVVAGNTWVTGAGLDMAVVKLNADGSRDASFGSDGLATVDFGLVPGARDDTAIAVAVDGQGRIVVAGATYKDTEQDLDFAVARLLGDGQLDPDFGGDGRQTVAFDLAQPFTDAAYTVLVDDDDGLFLVGTATKGDFDMAVARLLADGSPAAGFGVDGRVTVAFDLSAAGQDYDTAFGALRHGDRLLLVGAGAAEFGAGPVETVVMLAQLLPDGQLDPDFGLGGTMVLTNSFGGSNLASFAAVGGDGRAILGGLADTDGGAAGLVAQAILLDVLFADGLEP